MNKGAVSIRFVKFAIAESLTEAINLRLLLDRVQADYRVKNETLGAFTLPGPTGKPLFGAVEFHVPEDQADLIRQRIEELFSIKEDIPEICPACDHRVPAGNLECPECGLFLC